MTAKNDETGGVVYVTLKEHLAKLEVLESSKPPQQRRDVPSMAELARIIGIDPMTMSRWATNKTTATTHTTAAVIIKELRARGFPTNIWDILAYRET